MSQEVLETLPVGPIPGVEYPATVLYCGNCSLPIEVSENCAGLVAVEPFFFFLQYCEFYPDFEKCRQWLEKHLPNEFEKAVKISEKDDEAGEEEKKRQKRGGKGIVKPKKKEEVAKQICVSRAPRGKKKSVTVVTGLKTFGNFGFWCDGVLIGFFWVQDIDLKVASKFFGTRFACGSSVTGDDEIVIQGDVKDDLFDVIPEKWPQVCLFCLPFFDFLQFFCKFFSISFFDFSQFSYPF